MKQKYIVRKSIQAAYLKIMINYLQLISIIENLKLNWNSNILQFFKISSSVSGSLAKTIRLDCVFRGFSIFFLYIYI